MKLLYSNIGSYLYKDLPLGAPVARQLIRFLREGTPPFRLSEVRDEIEKYHLKHGGKQAEGKLDGITRAAVTQLRKDGVVEDVILGFWKVTKFHNFKSGDYAFMPKHIIGSGSDFVYLFYDMASRSALVKKGRFVWDCKIGMTTKEDPEVRIREQTTGASYEPEVPIYIRSDDAVGLESQIHNILRGKQRVSNKAKGNEWFLTNHVELEHIYNQIIKEQEI